MMPLKDPVARRAYHRDYMRRRLKEDPAFRAAHRKRVEKNKAKYRAEVDKLVEAFYAKGCLFEECPEVEPCCLTAHHIDPATKDFAIGRRGTRYSPKRIATELQKCVCLCANCHTKVHAGLKQLPDDALERQHSHGGMLLGGHSQTSLTTHFADQ